MAFLDEDVEFLLVGAFALAANGAPRFTGDLDVWVRPDPVNAERVLSGLRRFGAPVDVHGLGVEDLGRPGSIYQMGLPPRRIDVLTQIDGVTFDEAWQGRLQARVGNVIMPFLGLRELVRNKRAAGRPKDLLDIELLREAGAPIEDDRGVPFGARSGDTDRDV
ncbi:MAG: hypothetical protein Q8P18_30595 [Pseudomonadota bacterium]|nr:hypothetical protein [Pseudomonadota bacterium]